MQMPAITERDKRAVILLGIALAVFGTIYFWPEKKPEASRTVFSVPQAEKRLERMSRQAAALPAREEMLKKAKDELSRREKGILVADTPAQAQAKLLEIIRRVARTQQPPIMLRGGEFREVRPFGSAYGEASVTVQIEAGIEQILNFLADIGNQPELIALSDASFSQVTNKQKLVPARITVTGIVPRALVPRKEAAF
jgi:Tfp pilus assembly protein PilO